jgi:cysteine desulfurase
MHIYFDNAATTPVLPEVVEAMLPYFTEIFGNPSSTHAYGRKAKAAIESARKSIAAALHASPMEIVFTSCGTEANNMAIKCAVDAFDVKHIITSNAEHKCVFNTCAEIAQKRNIQLHYLAVDKVGHVSLNELESLLESLGGKVLVTLIHANNELGTITDIESVGQLCKKYDALFHSDTVQTVCHYDINLSELNVNFLSGSAHKFHGPKGAGFLYMRKDSRLTPFIHGGGQERNFRSGTENVAGIVGMARAMEIAVNTMGEDRKKISALKHYFIDKLQQSIPDVAFNGDVNGLYTVLNVSFPPSFQSDMLLFNLDLAGIAVSGGSACSSGASSGSHVLDAIGHPVDRKAVRFSFSRFNTEQEIDYVVETLLKMQKK